MLIHACRDVRITIRDSISINPDASATIDRNYSFECDSPSPCHHEFTQLSEALAGPFTGHVEDDAELNLYKRRGRPGHWWELRGTVMRDRPLRVSLAAQLDAVSLSPSDVEYAVKLDVEPRSQYDVTVGMPEVWVPASSCRVAPVLLNSHVEATESGFATRQSMSVARNDTGLVVVSLHVSRAA